MPSMKSLISQLSADYPEFQFVQADQFRWSAKQHLITIQPSSPYGKEFLLHELSHAILDHQHYDRDIQLIQYERDAWEYAATLLSAKYDAPIDDNVIQDNLDTYRDWLHARSSCPECRATGLQTEQRTYSCLACGTKWRVNEARICGLKRYITKTPR